MSKIKACFFLTLAIFLASCSSLPARVETAPDRSVDSGEAVTVYRDAFGTPHIFADSNYGVFFGYGYSVAEDRLFQMEMLRRTAWGTVSAVLGERYAPLDTMLRTHYHLDSIRSQVAQLDERDRAILQGYADGFNAKVRELTADPEQMLPKPFIDYDFTPSEWSANDVAAIFVAAIAFRYADFNSERDNLGFLQAMERKHGKDLAWDLFNTCKWLFDASSPTTVADQPVPSVDLLRPSYLDDLADSSGSERLVLDESGGFSGTSKRPEMAGRLRAQLMAQGFLSHPEFSPASNYWAISDLDDAPGALLNGPQFGFSMPGYVYGFGLHGGDFDVVGNTLLALPAMLFAHNNSIAWGSTAGLSDQTDEYMLTLNPANPEQYWYGDEWVEFDRWSERIEVRNSDTLIVEARRSVQGMVLDHSPDQGVAWVRARAWEGNELDSLMAWVWIATDRSIEPAVERIGDKVTNINMYLMDVDGRQAYVHSGRYPQRRPTHDSRLPAIGDGSQDWLGLRSYADNPKVIDPDKGYLVNWNNRPSADWRSSDLWSATWGKADRVSILIDAIEGLEDKTVANMVAINEQSTFADTNLPFLLTALNRALTSADIEAPVQDALQRLNNWDGQWRADADGLYAPAATIAEAWLSELLQQTFYDDIGASYWHLFSATHYPTTHAGPSIGPAPGTKIIVRHLDVVGRGQIPSYDFFNGESIDDVMARSFVAAIDRLRASWGDDSSRWLIKAPLMRWLPANFRGVPQASESNSVAAPQYQNRGSENNVFIATGDGFRGFDVIPPGQGGHLLPSGQPAPHYDDQLELYNGFEHKPVYFTRTEVEENAMSKRVLIPAR
ncbi:penicillin G acylase [Luminiphilus syltensis NOR5-1B]|uniref:Penicillin G acylase n=1 Tax=Luminiphilus syltensis NOR5-1B TaxID=565045 RepID=B8KT87_9GAMM|nr:penicillin acylase family protein [Luminiphilus syltensis]EED35844.1 penicillin G acylase [Luminiphilus syltensis NOR5-1B]